MKYARELPPRLDGAPRDYAEREKPLPPGSLDDPRRRGTVTLARGLFLALVGIAAFFAFTHYALARADVIEAMCADSTPCFERYCAQDMSCDAPTPAEIAS